MMKSFITHLECTYCGETYSCDEIHNTCKKCGKVLYARYDLAGAAKVLSKADLLRRPGNMWRWFEIMPVKNPANVVTLGEGYTPLLPALRLGKRFGSSRLFIKEEGLNPTGSFKARGMSAAVSKAKELGVTAIGAPSAGNAASALSAYGARAGMKIAVFMPTDAPEMMKREGHMYGADVYLVKGLINDAGAIVRAASPSRGWFDVSTLKEPYRQEGKKTMGLELAEQFNWELPDAILYPTGGGTGIVGMWKAFDELERMGWIGSKRPKMIVVQAEGCSPIVKAWREGKRHAELFPNASTIAAGLRVPIAIGDYLMIDALSRSNGTAISVTDAEIREAMGEVAREEGVFSSPEGAATWAAYKRLIADKFLSPDDSAVLFNCGSLLKNAELIDISGLPVLDPKDPELLTKIN
ncbi:MAG: threonine synthase [Thermoflexales bacterium]|nr:threonine synthase [Thermoflexales bacterium]